MRPFDGYAQPGVTRAPSPWSHKHIVAPLFKEGTVEPLYLVGDSGVVHRGEIIIGLHIHYICHILADAMAE